MACVITEPCADCQDAACASACPIDIIHPGVVEWEGRRLNQLFIHTDECICCGLCEPECPVDAIYLEDELPDQWKHYKKINAMFYRSSS